MQRNPLGSVYEVGLLRAYEKRFHDWLKSDAPTIGSRLRKWASCGSYGRPRALWCATVVERLSGLKSLSAILHRPGQPASLHERRLDGEPLGQVRRLSAHIELLPN